MTAGSRRGMKRKRNMTKKRNEVEAVETTEGKVIGNRQKTRGRA